MKIEFQYFTPESVIPHIPVTFKRVVSAVPQKQDIIVHHRYGKTLIFKVKDVYHVYEDREEYKDKDYGGDRIIVTLLIY